MSSEKKPFAYFAEINVVSESSKLFESLEEKDYRYYYFQKNQLYYLFLYGEYGNHLTGYFMSFIKINRELDTKKRKIRSIRGFLLYALEFIGDEIEVNVLKTNFDPLFWKRVQRVIRQNRKSALLEFLFGTKFSAQTFGQTFDIKSNYSELKNQIQTMQNEVGSLKRQLQVSVSTNLEEQNKNDSIISSPRVIFKNFKDLTDNELFLIIYQGYILNKDYGFSLKEYYEGQDHPKSIFRTKNYCIKYESIRKSSTYKWINSDDRTKLESLKQKIHNRQLKLEKV